MKRDRLGQLRYEDNSGKRITTSPRWLVCKSTRAEQNRVDWSVEWSRVEGEERRHEPRNIKILC